jgi:integrase
LGRCEAEKIKEFQVTHPVVDPEEWPEAVGLMFVTEFGRPVNVNSLVYKHFKPILKRAGLPNIRLYDLRHTAATLALIVGVSPKVVSEQLGHTSAAFTLDVYSHVLPHMQDDAATKVEAALLGNP